MKGVMSNRHSLQVLVGALLTVSQAARRLGVSANMVRIWADAGRLNCVRVSDSGRGVRYFHPLEVEAFGLERQVKALMSGRKKPGPKSRVVQLEAAPTKVA